MRFGVNLYGVSDAMMADPKTFFTAVKKMGLRYVEPCVTIGPELSRTNRLFGKERLAGLMEEIRAAGLQVESVHAFITEKEGAAEEMAELAKTYGVKQFVLRDPRTITKEAYEEAAEDMLKYIEALKPYEAWAALHNEAYDSIGQIEGKPAFVWMLERCGGKLRAQADTGWLLAGGMDPEAFVWKYKDYIASVHYKDMSTENKEVPLGSGRLDGEPVFQFCRAEEKVQYIDQDDYFGKVYEQLEAAAKWLAKFQNMRSNSSSILCLYDIETNEVTELKHYDYVIEAPNWMPHEETLVYNWEGRLYRYDIEKGTDTLVDTGICTSCNNDHVLAADGSGVAVSNFADGLSLVYTIPFATGVAKQVTPVGHSWLHGWSPDGEELAYCAFRKDENGEMHVDICAISKDGGEEWKLTENAGFNDGPEYSFDGKKIWFISTRSGYMQVYKMNRDGSEQTQMTFEEQNNWFGHISPDNRKVVNIAYSKDGLDPSQHLANMHVSLWLMNEDGSDRHKILDFFGGQGSINVNSWASDSRRFAFVKYELHHK